MTGGEGKELEEKPVDPSWFDELDKLDNDTEDSATVGGSGDTPTAVVPGESATDTIEWLFDNIRRHDFVSAVRRIHNLYPDKSTPGQASKLSNEALRLSQNVSTSFTGTSLDRIEQGKGKHPFRLYVNFLGLLGSNGPMPYHYTEYADQRARHLNDPSFAEFLDFYNHRMLSLFYRAIADLDPSINLDRPDSNNFDLFIGSLAGLSFSDNRARDQIPYYAKLQYANWMGCKSKSPDGVKSIVGDYFDLKVEVDEFVGAWLSLPDNALTSLGTESGNMELGRNIYIGRRVWSSRHKFRVRLGPLSWRDYLSFKPGGERAKELYDLIRNYVGDEWDWELELVLEERTVHPMKLDRTNLLGFTSWLSGRSSHQLPEQRTVLGRDVISTQIH